MKWVGGLNHKIYCDSYSYSQEIHSQVPEAREHIRLELHPYDH